MVVLCGFVLFQFFGNSTRGFLETRSMFHWWVADWFNFEGETTHGPLILILSGWILWQNLKIAIPASNQPRFMLGLVLVLGVLMCTGKSGHEILLNGESKHGKKTQYRVQK